MPELLKHILESLLNNDYSTLSAKNHVPKDSTAYFIILDRAAPKSLTSHLKNHNAPYTLLNIDEYLNSSQNQKDQRKPIHYKEPSGLIITQKVAEDNQIALASLLSCSFLNIPVIVYTNQPTVTEIVSFIRSGVIDYWSKSSEYSAIQVSIENLLLISRKRKYNRDLILEMQRRIKTLTKREEQVINVLLSTEEEMTNKKIASYLKLSPRTIEDYRAKAMTKLAINTKNELALVWLISQQLEPQLHSN